MLSSLANNHQRSTEQVKGQALLNDFTVNIVTFSYVGMCMLTWFQCLSMMKTGPVSNGTDSLRFFDSLCFVDCSRKLQIISSQMEHNRQEF